MHGDRNRQTAAGHFPFFLTSILLLYKLENSKEKCSTGTDILLFKKAWFGTLYDMLIWFWFITGTGGQDTLHLLLWCALTSDKWSEKIICVYNKIKCGNLWYTSTIHMFDGCVFSSKASPIQNFYCHTHKWLKLKICYNGKGNITGNLKMSHLKGLFKRIFNKVLIC